MAPTARIARRSFAIFMLVSMTSLTACPGETQREAVPRATDETCGRVVTTPRLEAGDVRDRGLVAYAREDALWVYDISSDSGERVKDDLVSAPRSDPQFLGDRSLTFVEMREEDELLPFGRDSLFALELGSGALTELLRFEGTVLSYRWSADRTELAYEIWTTTFRLEEGKRVPFGQNSLCLYDVKQREPKVVRRLEYVVGRGGHESDERKITWSPSGDSILVVDTVQPIHIYVLSLDGRDVIPPRIGTFARWLDERTIMYREENRLRTDGGLRKGRWFTIDIVTGQRGSFAMPNGVSRPEISPNGRMIAFDDGDREHPSTYVFDRSTGRTSLLVRGHGAPIWLSNDIVAVTAGGPCPPRTECNDFWTPLGRTISVDVGDGTRKRLKLPTTGPFVENVDLI